ncbi:BNR/Asp-box repeat protein [Pseudomonas syringae pv. rhaphiolepidis]|nr:BNR/Asp-box repeat protein [Pseudomonas syringae pv. rhaphiolepidis]
MRVISQNLTAWSAGLIVVVIFLSAWLSHPQHRMSAFVVSTAPVDAESVAPKASYISRFASSDLDDFVHSSAVTALPGGDLMSVWFAGSREGAGDVEIRTSRFDASNGEWGGEQVLATRASTQSGTGKYIRKLGNPVIALAPDNRLWLFYVSVSVGGWAGSTVNAMVSSDMGASWSPPWQLVTSPFLNISTLVRGAPVFHTDGSIGLPVYHEFLGKFAEYLYLSADGEVIDKFRISRGKKFPAAHRRTVGRPTRRSLAALCRRDVSPGTGQPYRRRRSDLERAATADTQQPQLVAGRRRRTG